jgi:hypothetical protein
MRKYILSIFLVAVATFNSYSQCTPNTSITQAGIYPDSATGLAGGVVGQAYNQEMQLRVPLDTLVDLLGTGTPSLVPITSISLTAFNNLPAGLTYSCNPPTCVFPGGTNGCVLISGTPLVAGTFLPLAVTTTAGTVFGFPVTQVDTIDYYVITISNSSTGLYESTSSAFQMDQNTPNPSEEMTAIRFFLPHPGDVEFRMFNMIGKEVYRNLLSAEQGENSFRIDSRLFSEGVYMYSMTYDQVTLSRRMVISRK